VRQLDEIEFVQEAIVFLCADRDVAERVAPRAVERGALVIDNSSAFRLAPDVPLVVPSVNGESIGANDRLIANPNCSTILLVSVLAPIQRAFGLKRVVVSTYQAVSGAGAAGLEELDRSTLAEMSAMTASSGGGSFEPQVFPEPIAFNVFCHESPVDPDTGRNGEEQKVIDESRRILGLPDLPVSVTCVRVPVRRAHAESVNVTLERPAQEGTLRDVLGNAADLLLIDDRRAGMFPTPLRASGRDEVLVGRLRGDQGQAVGSDDSAIGFELFLCGDQLRTGAALNAWRIAEWIAARRG